MGVAGAGKTTVGKALADLLGWEFLDADDYHPRENIQKMTAGIPLTDEDRMPWLNKLVALISEKLSVDQPIVLACSALQHAYQKQLQFDDCIFIVYLKVPFQVLQKRMRQRKDHFMKEPMLQSQLEALEEPVDALVVEAVEAVEDPLTVAQTIRRKLSLSIEK